MAFPAPAHIINNTFGVIYDIIYSPMVLLLKYYKHVRAHPNTFLFLWQDHTDLFNFTLNHLNAIGADVYSVRANKIKATLTHDR